MEEGSTVGVTVGGNGVGDIRGVGVAVKINAGSRVGVVKTRSAGITVGMV